ncbi:MAG: bifunctional diguanylate cyclase/phosphodiesterase [Oscillospiraceae bacterium]|nr:bifunctional diguanylate cyclase/phosphodiesterase [Oscillospiraceae bacterium]
MKDKNKKVKQHTIATDSLLYIFTALLIIYISRGKVSINVAGIIVDSGRSSGILSVLLTLYSAHVVLRCKKSGMINSLILNITEILMLSSTIFIKKSLEATPGIAIVAGGIGVTVLIRHFQIESDKNEEKLENLVYLDPLTNIPNRRYFMKKLSELSEKPGCHFALVFIDLDNFKAINDTSGHETGDCVLNEVVKRWNMQKRKNEFMARLGGDEFAVVIPDYTNENILRNRVESFSVALNEKFYCNGRNIFMSACMGVVRYPYDSTDINSVFKYSDIAMYNAKNSGKKGISYFEHSMVSGIEKAADIFDQINYSLENELFYIVYQPQFSLRDNELRGFEALIRMKDKDGSLVSSDLFIPLAEKNGLIRDVECWVLSRALNQFKPILEKCNRKITLSINISAVHILHNEFINDINLALEVSDFPPENLELEITESAFLVSVNDAVRKINILKKSGIKIALDDFGTGYASLTYITKLPIDLLKIDKSFIEAINDNPDYDSIKFINTIISMAHILNFSVIAEGVETQKQLTELTNMDCDYMQGFLKGRPVSLREAEELFLS